VSGNNSWLAGLVNVAVAFVNSIIQTNGSGSRWGVQSNRQKASGPSNPPVDSKAGFRQNGNGGKPAPCTQKLKEGGTRAGFFANLPAFQGMAKALGTDADFIMAVSSWESGWLGTHAQEIQNLFGLTENGGPDLSYVGRGGYQASADYWVRRIGPYVRNKKTMPDFLKGLRTEGYNRNPAYYPTIGNQLRWVRKWERICAN